MIVIIGCPSPGFYGDNCSIPCPNNCHDSPCHIVEGNCLGCLPGYRGLTCIDGNENILKYLYRLTSFPFWE